MWSPNSSQQSHVETWGHLEGARQALICWTISIQRGAILTSPSTPEQHGLLLTWCSLTSLKEIQWVWLTKTLSFSDTIFSFRPSLDHSDANIYHLCCFKNINCGNGHVAHWSTVCLECLKPWFHPHYYISQMQSHTDEEVKRGEGRRIGSSKLSPARQ